MKEKLELLQTVLVCVLLLVAIYASVLGRKTATETLDEVVRLRAVVCEQGEKLDAVSERTEAAFQLGELEHGD